MGNGGHHFCLWIGDALILVHVQNDFLPGGALAVPEGDRVVPVLNDYVRRFSREGLPVYAVRAWHPVDHHSFHSLGGPWPPHCVAGSPGAEFPRQLILPPAVRVLSLAATRDAPGHSAFDDNDFALRLRRAGVKRLFVGGLATDYGVLHTVREAHCRGFDTVLLTDAIRALDIHPGDGERAQADMLRCGAIPCTLADLPA